MGAVDEHIGKKLRFYRVAVGMKQRELAEKLGISYQQVQKYESAKDKISIERLVLIASVLDVPVSAFLEDIEKDYLNHGRQTLNLMRYFLGIDEEKKRNIIVEIVKILFKLSKNRHLT